jgi:chromate reductase, NAD(P)H dehydrogenase (quinone)
MSTRVIEAASVSLPLGSNRLEEEAILARADLRGLLLASIESLQAWSPGGQDKPVQK